jgi:mono/diheme cytochrome c family protein
MRLAFSGALMLLTSAAQAQDPIEQGRKIAQEFCSPCHAIGRTGASPRDEAPPFRELSRTFDLDRFPELLERGFSSNHPDMPTFKFDEEGARALRAYLRTIQE